MGLKVIVTGGAGYVGTAVVEALQRDIRVEKVVVYDCLIRNDRRFFFQTAGGLLLDKVQFIKGDIQNTEKLQSACEGMDALVHLAAFVDEPFRHSQHVQYDQINTYGSLSVVRALEQRSEIEKVVNLSSSAVWGFRSDIKLSDEPNPQNGYATSKRRGELYFEKLLDADSARVKTLRAAHIYGFNRAMRFDTLVHSFLFEAMTGGRIEIFGNGEQIRPFIHIDKVAASIVDEVFGHSSTQGELLADFQCDINSLLQWMLSRFKEIEYRYLTPSVEHPSQSFSHLSGIEHRDLDRALRSFRTSMAMDHDSVEDNLA